MTKPIRLALLAVGIAAVGVWSDVLGYSARLFPAAAMGGTANVSAAFTWGRLAIALLFCLLARRFELHLETGGLVAGVAVAPLALVMVLACNQSALDPGAVCSGASFVGSAASLYLSTALFIVLCHSCSTRTAALVATIGILGECVLAVLVSLWLPLEGQLAVCTIAPLIAAACLCAARSIVLRGLWLEASDGGLGDLPVLPHRATGCGEEGPRLHPRRSGFSGVDRFDRLSSTLMMVQLVLAMVVSSSLRSLSPMGPWGLLRQNYLGMASMDAGMLLGVCGIVGIASLVLFVLPQRLSSQAQFTVALVVVLGGLLVVATGDLSVQRNGLAGMVAMGCQLFSRVFVWVALMACMRQLEAPAFLINGAACVFNVFGSWTVAGLRGTGVGEGTAVMWLMFALIVVALVGLALPSVAAQRGMFGGGIAWGRASSVVSTGDRMAEGCAAQTVGVDEIAAETGTGRATTAETVQTQIRSTQTLAADTTATQLFTAGFPAGAEVVAPVPANEIPVGLLSADLHRAALHDFAGRYAVSPREEQVLGLLIDGRKRGEIERLLGLSEGTVRTHINSIYRKLGVHSKGETSEAFERWVARDRTKRD